MSHRRLFVSRKRKVTIDPEDVFLDASNAPGFDADHLEGTLERPLSRHIPLVTFFLIVVVFSGFAVKLFSLQVIGGDLYEKRAFRNATATTPIFSHRGTIEDRNGVLLAWNEQNAEDEIPLRQYTATSGFSHLLGYVSYPKKDKSGVFWQDEYVGKDGVERQYQNVLQGIAGVRTIEVSATNDIISNNVTISPRDGQNITLTVDGSVQSSLYQAIESLSRKAGFVGGAGVIMDVNTGEVLALASYPEYDNNRFTNANSTDDKEYVRHILSASEKPLLNRAVNGAFTPGSTVKPFVALAALAEKVITPEKSIYSSGALVVKNRFGGPDSIFRDWKAHDYVNMRQAIAQSSDEYFYQVGGGFEGQSGLGIDTIYSYMKKYGFETRTGIDLPGEVEGTIPSREWKKKMFKDGKWLLGDTYVTSIGQYGFKTTVLELARSYALLANGTHMPTPFVKQGEQKSGVSVSVDEEDLKVIREGLRMTVTSDQGTAKVLRFSDLSVAAKTGTAELGVSKDKVNSWVAAYFPYEKPRFVIAVVMEKAARENTFGATLAARDVLDFMRKETSYTK